MPINEQRAFWIDSMLQIAMPVLSALSQGQLRKTMPIERKRDDRISYACLEAFGRTLCGIGPWLTCRATGKEEQKRKEVFEIVLRCLDNATNPDSPDFMNFCEGPQPLVDAAFLSHGLLRAGTPLVQALDKGVKLRLANCLKSSRTITPGENNWILFSAMVETALFLLGEPDFDMLRIKYALRQFMQWYLGDGIYGDGSMMHMDYYNSFVIVPMLVDISRVFASKDDEINKMHRKIINRASRYAEILERIISPEGTYPIVGRSITYRFGVFQLLSQAGLQHFLPESLCPAQVRCALTAVIERIMRSYGLFDDRGWLKIGVAGSQSSLGEFYITTGSLYLCSTVFVALGLPQEDPFWNGENMKWTNLAVFDGQDMPLDHFIEG